MRRLLPLLLLAASGAGLAGEPAPFLKLTAPVEKIWDRGNHNAFTDLIRFRGRWLCVFREGSGHASGAGAVRVLASEDGRDWQPLALITKDKVDLRDPHISVTPDGRLMINGGAAFPITRDPVTDHYSWVSFSADGGEWTPPRRVLDSWQWLWRVTWHGGKGYGIAYGWDRKAEGAKRYHAALVRTGDGLDWEKVTDLDIPQTTEATVRFDGDTMLVLQRRDGSPNTALLGRSEPPYTKFTWQDLGRYYGGPNMVKGPDGRWWAAGRIIDQGAKTVVGYLDLDAGKLTPVLTLPSGGDNSYPGLVWHDGTLWISYYSSHEGKTSIYLAKAKLQEE